MNLRLPAVCLIPALAATAVGSTLLQDEPPSRLDFLEEARPGPAHERLAALEGEWEVIFSPAQGGGETLGEGEARTILGGRFVEEKVRSEWMGQPFEGLGIIGYDNVREEFTMVWCDNMSTGTWYTTGQMSGTTFTFEGENSDYMTGEANRWGKSVLEMGSDKHTFKGYTKDKSGTTFQNMEMVATPK